MPDQMPYGADTIVIPFTFVPDQTSRGKPPAQDTAGLQTGTATGGSIAPTRSARLRRPRGAQGVPLEGRDLG